jgi:hypothetical protein
VCMCVSSTPLFDVSTAGASCTQLPYAGSTAMPAGQTCLHEVGVWQVWTVDAAAEFVLLGDLTAYVSLSGYRLRLPEHSSPAGSANGSGGGAGEESFVVVGMPGEKVELTYLRRDSAAAGVAGGVAGGGGTWTVHVQSVVVGATGRALVTLK